MSSLHIKLKPVCAALRVAGLSSFSALVKVTLGVFVSSPQPCQKNRDDTSLMRCAVDSPDLSDRMLNLASCCQSGEEETTDAALWMC